MSSKSPTKQFWCENLDCHSAGRAVVLSAVRVDNRAQVFLKSGTPAAAVEPGIGAHLIEARSIANGPWLTLELAPGAPLQLRIDGQDHEIPTHAPDPDFLAGQNVLLGLRNAEDAKTVLDWLHYHAKHHGMTGALIVSRHPAEADTEFCRILENALPDVDGLERLLIVHFGVPLGVPDQPPQAHPFNAPDAPGKARMDLPPSDPWLSPLSEGVIFELLHRMFLTEVRALASLEVVDLIPPDSRGTVFDLAINSPVGAVLLAGFPVYPWQLRDRDNASFGDHTCVRTDSIPRFSRWCIAPGKAGDGVVWRPVRLVGLRAKAPETLRFYRFMAMRHDGARVGQIVPRSGLFENVELTGFVKKVLGAKPIRMPKEPLPEPTTKNGQVTIVTTMKNEAPFILEWLAYHRAIGVTDFLVYTNDCTDGTDQMLEILQKKGLVQHRDNPYRKIAMRPQHAALQVAEKEEIVSKSEWLICMDVDEFINIHVGDGRLPALFKAIGKANMIAMNWRLFGNAGHHDYGDEFIIRRFTRCAQKFANKPHQAWGFKTLYRNIGLFRKMGVHRPKGIVPQYSTQIDWVNGSGQPLPRAMFPNAWRSNAKTFGYDLVTLNHYAVRSAESFLVKRDRGRVNHVERDQGLAYWFRMNNNREDERSIQRMLPLVEKEFALLMSDPDIQAAHEKAVNWHFAKIAELKSDPDQMDLFCEITSERMEKLSHLHPYFGANVFLAGPDAIPDEVVARDPDDKFFFTVEPVTEAAH